MDFSKKTPRKEITVQGQKLSVPQPFEEGHAVTVNEAHALNQVLAENIRNNMAATVKNAEEGMDIQAALDSYVQGYEFGVRAAGGGGGRTLSPQEKEARNIAAEAVKNALARQGYTITGDAGVGREKFNELRDQYAAREDVLQAAARRVEEADKLADAIGQV